VFLQVILLRVALNKRRGCNVAWEDPWGKAGGGGVDSRKVAGEKIEKRLEQDSDNYWLKQRSGHKITYEWNDIHRCWTLYSRRLYLDPVGVPWVKKSASGTSPRQRYRSLLMGAWERKTKVCVWFLPGVLRHKPWPCAILSVDQAGQRHVYCPCNR